MSNAFDSFCRMLLVRIPTEVLLSVVMRVDGCGCPISVSVVRSATACFAFMNAPPVSALAAELTTLGIVRHWTSTAPLGAGLSLSVGGVVADVKVSCHSAFRAWED